MEASEEQLKHCEALPNITFRQGCAESTGLPSHSVDLVTVATALRWYAHAELARFPLGITHDTCPARKKLKTIVRALMRWPTCLERGCPSSCIPRVVCGMRTLGPE